jgi:hypothetical protein
MRMAIVGMCSNESGIENSRMFIGAPPALVRPGRDRPGPCEVLPRCNLRRSVGGLKGLAPKSAAAVGKLYRKIRKKRWRQPALAFTRFYRV